MPRVPGLRQNLDFAPLTSKDRRCHVSSVRPLVALSSVPWDCEPKKVRLVPKSQLCHRARTVWPPRKGGLCMTGCPFTTGRKLRSGSAFVAMGMSFTRPITSAITACRVPAAFSPVSMTSSMALFITRRPTANSAASKRSLVTASA